MKVVGVRFLLILSILLTVVSAAITYRGVQLKKEVTSLVIHHYQVIQASTRLLSLLKDMEIGHRGYLITADTSFLSPYHEALRELDDDMDTLSLLIDQNPRQLEIFSQHLAPLVTRRRAHLEESLQILQIFGRDSAAHFVGMQAAKVQMDSIHMLTSDFIAYEQTLLNERNASLEQRYLINDVIRFSSFALIGIISMAALVTINNKEKDNRRLLIELQQFNQQLEEKVKERTRELQAANLNLVQLNEEKNHFLGITTHDLKAPLAGINGLLEVMKLDKASLSSKHLEYIQLMEETCNNMQRLITDLLDLSRIEQGTTYMNPQEVSIIKIFSQLEDRFRPWASKKNISLNFHYPHTAGVIRIDKDILIRILDNLVSNAIKFSPRDKSVNVSAFSNGPHFHIDIQDQGPGIQPDEKDKLFMRFQKLHARPTDGESSTGLGLSIVKDLVGLLKGSIEVKSDVGQGALFKITLPKQYNDKYQL